MLLTPALNRILDTSQGIVQWPEDYFPLITQDYIKYHDLTASKIGNADSYLFDAQSLNHFAIEWMENHFSK